MKLDQLQSLAASFEAARNRTDGDRLQVLVTQEEAGEVSKALQARINGHQMLGVLPAGATVLGMTNAAGRVIVATSLGVYGLAQDGQRFELIPLEGPP